MSIVRVVKVLLFLVFVTVISGCNPPNYFFTPSHDPILTNTFPVISPTPDPPTDTPDPTLTATSTVTPTPVWIFQSGVITCPILLYHRIADPPLPYSMDARYYIPPMDFTWQMQALKDWGYSTIPISLLVEAITKGALLPPRPVVITFDDGDESVFTNAYPIMQDQGFIGVMYLVGSYVGSKGYMDAVQLQTMTRNGWEIGNHSMTHPHLPSVPDQIYYEAVESKDRLVSEIGVEIKTFAYPFGEIDPFIVQKIVEYGYLAAVGLGTQYIHGLDSLYYLNRLEVRNGVDLQAFGALLPWSGQP